MSETDLLRPDSDDDRLMDGRWNGEEDGGGGEEGLDVGLVTCAVVGEAGAGAEAGAELAGEDGEGGTTDSAGGATAATVGAGKAVVEMEGDCDGDAFAAAACLSLSARDTIQAVRSSLRSSVGRPSLAARVARAGVTA